MRLLAGDIGGTHCRLAIAEAGRDAVNILRAARYASRGHANLEAILADFLGAEAAPEACCLAVAGPTDGRRARFTNLDWNVDAAALAARFGFRHALLVNDFAAVGWGLDGLGAEQLAPLQAGDAVAHAPRLALGAGTGLGVCLCVWRDGGYRPLASEGGHIGFAPLDATQDRLLAHLRRAHGRVSVERILSGPGIVELYRFCLAEAGRADSPLLREAHPAAAITAAGLAGDDAAAAHGLRLFAQILGQTAGDLALATRAEGGVYLAGGIAPQVLPALRNGDFLRGFHAKGRFAEWTRNLPVAVVLDADIGLRGAARAAMLETASS